MKNTILYILFIFSIQSIASAQAPGFMGKKIAFDYNGDVSWLGLYASIGPPLSYEHNFGLEYVLTKRLAIHGNVGFLSLKIPGSSVESFNGVATTYQIGAKIYKSPYISPVGKYHSIEVGIVHLEAKNVANSIFNQDYLSKPKNYIAISYYNEKTTIIGNSNLFYKIGWGSQLLLGSNLLDNTSASLERQMASIIFLQNLIKLKAGIGILL